MTPSCLFSGFKEVSFDFQSSVKPCFFSYKGSRGWVLWTGQDHSKISNCENSNAFLQYFLNKEFVAFLPNDFCFLLILKFYLSITSYIGSRSNHEWQFDIGFNRFWVCCLSKASYPKHHECSDMFYTRISCLAFSVPNKILRASFSYGLH